MLTLNLSETWELSLRIIIRCQEEKEEPLKETKEKEPEKYEENPGSGVPEAN